MNPIRLLARQTARTTLQTDRRRAQLDAALGAGMPEHWYLTARWKWAQDTGVARKLFEEACEAGLQIARQRKWREADLVVPDMVELALAELMWPASFRTDEQRRDWLRWSKGAWGRRRAQYQDVYRLIDGWSNAAYGYLLAVQKTT